MILKRVIAAIAEVYAVPDTQALRGKYESQLVHGEDFIVEEEIDGWSRGTCAHDGYPGYVPSAQLVPATGEPTHVVTAIRTDIYRDDTIKSPILGTLSIGSRFTVAAQEEKFSRLEGGGWIYTRHTASIGTYLPDYVATAEKFLETPYRWGGRSGSGIDCSGLVQVCLAFAGVSTERDTDEQIDTIGTPADMPQRGDIVFFKGHVGIMADDTRLINADGLHAMKVVVEPLQDTAVARGGITGIRRL